VTPEKVTHPTLYDAPEAESGDISFATDVWGLGVTLVEALTQYAPSWPGGHAEPPALPSNLPASFAELIQRCLSVNPSDRPTIPELQEKTKPAAPESLPRTVAPSATSAVMTPEQARQEIADRASGQSPAGAAAPTGEEVIRADSGFAQPITPSYALEPEPQRRGPTGMIVAAIVVLVVVWGGWRLFHHSASPMPETPGPVASPDETAATAATSGVTDATGAQGPSEPTAAPPRGAPQLTSPSVSTNSQAGSARVAPGRKSTGATGDSAADGSVVHQEIPSVSQSSRQTIHGHIKVAVKVTVDRSGNVVRDALESGSSSKYFNRVASEAARKWRFAAADGEGSRQWLLHFEFGRDGTTVRASRSGS
jgi:TonB family protein